MGLEHLGDHCWRFLYHLLFLVHKTTNLQRRAHSWQGTSQRKVDCEYQAGLLQLDCNPSCFQQVKECEEIRNVEKRIQVNTCDSDTSVLTSRIDWMQRDCWALDRAHQTYVL